MAVDFTHFDMLYVPSYNNTYNNIMKEIQIDGCVQIPDNQNQDNFDDKFQSWCETEGYLFSGGTDEIREGEPTAIEIYANSMSTDFGFWLIQGIYGKNRVQKSYIENKFKEFIKETK